MTTEVEDHEYICWSEQYQPSRISAIGPETAAREYVAGRMQYPLSLVPIDGPQSLSCNVTVMDPDGSYSIQICVELFLSSRVLQPAQELYYREKARAEEAVVQIKELQLERDRLLKVILEINDLESQARSGDAGALLEAEAEKAKEAQGSGIVFTEGVNEGDVRAIVDSDGNARLYPDRKPNTEGETP